MTTTETITTEPVAPTTTGVLIKHDPARHNSFLRTLERLVRYLGQSRAGALLAETAAIEATGRMLLADGSRRRTRGGVFFFLARQLRRPPPRPGPQRRRRRRPPAPTRPRPRCWQTWRAGSARSPARSGSSWSAALGRSNGQPAALVAFETVGAPAAPFPRGVPDAPGTPTRYLVLVAGKQWRSVAGEQAADAGNRLLVEGVPSLDARLPDLITMHVTKVQIVGPRQGKG